MLLTCADQKQIQVDRDFLLKYSYFKNIYEETGALTFDLPFPSDVVNKFIGIDPQYDFDDLELADFISSDEYLFIITEFLLKKYGLCKPITRLLKDRHVFHLFPKQLLEYLIEKLKKKKIILYERNTYFLRNFKYQALKKFFDKMFINHLQILVKSLPSYLIKFFPAIHERYVKIYIYIELCECLYHKIGSKMEVFDDENFYNDYPMAIYIQRNDDAFARIFLDKIKSASDINLVKNEIITKVQVINESIINLYFEKYYLKLKATADCCGISWFEMENGNEPHNEDFKDIIGRKFKDVYLLKGLDDGIKNDDIVKDDSLIYLMIDDTIFKFYLRNTSNGYYPGIFDVRVKEL